MRQKSWESKNDLQCESGVVISVSGPDAVVLMHPGSACSGCHSRELCFGLSGGEREVEMRNPIGARTGQRVEFTVSPGIRSLASFLLYLLPCIAFVAGLVGGSALFGSERYGAGSDLYAMVSGLICLCVVFVLLRLLSRRLSRDSKFTPRIVRVLGEDESSPFRQDPL